MLEYNQLYDTKKGRGSVATVKAYKTSGWLLNDTMDVIKDDDRDVYPIALGEDEDGEIVTEYIYEDIVVGIQNGFLNLNIDLRYYPPVNVDYRGEYIKHNHMIGEYREKAKEVILTIDTDKKIKALTCMIDNIYGQKKIGKAVKEVKDILDVSLDHIHSYIFLYHLLKEDAAERLDKEYDISDEVKDLENKELLSLYSKERTKEVEGEICKRFLIGKIR